MIHFASHLHCLPEYVSHGLHRKCPSWPHGRANATHVFASFGRCPGSSNKLTSTQDRRFHDARLVRQTLISAEPQNSQQLHMVWGLFVRSFVRVLVYIGVDLHLSLLQDRIYRAHVSVRCVVFESATQQRYEASHAYNSATSAGSMSDLLAWACAYLIRVRLEGEISSSSKASS